MADRGFWGRGNYARVAHRLEPVARALVDAVEVRAGHRVLDAAAGTGNVALAAREAGAEVVAFDISSVLVRQGVSRLSEIGQPVAWLEADAQCFPFAGASFDRVLSTFGIMYAPDPRMAAAEALRCLAPGGRIATTAWTPNSFSAASRRVVEAVVGPSKGPSTEAWSDRAFLESIFEGRHIEVSERVLVSEFGSPEHWWIQARDSAPPLVALRAAVEEATFEAIGKELTALAARFNEVEGPRLLLRQEYALAAIT